MAVAAIESKTMDPHSSLAYDALANGDEALLELIILHVRLRARRRAAWLANLASTENEEAGTSAIANLKAALDGQDTPAAEAAWRASAEEIQPLNLEIAQVEEALAGECGVPLQHLADLFRLSQAELELLQTCVAVAIEPDLGSVFAYLHHNPAHNYATAELVARLFGHGRRLAWSESCPLAVWGLIIGGDAPAGEPVPLSVDPVIIAWLQGELRIDPTLLGVVQLCEQRTPLDNWPVEQAIQLIERTIERGTTIRLLVAGLSGSGRRTFAASVAARFGMQTLSVNTTDVAAVDWAAIYMRVQRLALLGNSVLVWHGNQLNRPWPTHIVPAPIQCIACGPDEVIPSVAIANDNRLELLPPSKDERHKLWKAAIPEAAAWSVGDLETLAARYRLNVGDIAQVAANLPSSRQVAVELVRESTRYQLGELAKLIDCPFNWDDLVVPTQLCTALDDFVFEARDRAAFWESSNARRLFPRGTGLVALFSGSPGTGKSMAAQVLAADLQLDLFRVDLASIVSKYIGETAKRLGQVFARAASMNAVLLFDEADALFSKRTEVKDSHDRYANADTNYLLQLLEDYSGIVILASNKKQNIDSAFMRRIRYVLDFPRPTAPERQKIWTKLIGELNGTDTLGHIETTIKILAENVELSGAQIKSALLSAIFMSRQTRQSLAMFHLLRGIERELTKEGRALSADEHARLSRNG